MSNFFQASDLRQIFQPLHDNLSRRFTQHKTYLGEFAVVVSLFYMSILGKKGYSTVLKAMAEDLNELLEWEDLIPSNSALTQARRKVPEERFKILLSQLYDSCTHAKQHPILQFHHHRLVAVDGTDIELPSDRRLRCVFAAAKKSKADPDSPDLPHAGLVMLQDISHDLPINFEITNTTANERACTLKMMDHLHHGDVLIADRGFPSKEIFHQLAERKIDFVIRLAKNQFTESGAFAESGKREGTITIDCKDAKGRKNVWKKPLHLRLVRDDNVDPDGDPRILITSLTDTKKYPTEDIWFCYARRWRIETAFREMKIYDGLEHIQARTPAGVRQEISAIVIFQLLISELAGVIRHQEPELSQVKPATNIKAIAGRTETAVYHTTYIKECPYNFNRVLMRTCLHYLLKHALAEDWTAAQRSLMTSVKYLWRCKQKRRPGRSYSRIPKSVHAKAKPSRRRAASKRAKDKNKNKKDNA